MRMSEQGDPDQTVTSDGMDLMAHHAEYPVIEAFLEFDRRIRGVFRLQPALATPDHQPPDDDLAM